MMAPLGELLLMQQTVKPFPGSRDFHPSRQTSYDDVLLNLNYLESRTWTKDAARLTLSITKYLRGQKKGKKVPLSVEWLKDENTLLISYVPFKIGTGSLKSKAQPIELRNE